MDNSATWQPRCGATMVGSMPHKNRRYIINLIIEKLKEIPFWPQLSSYPEESMMVQYLEGLPGVEQRNGNYIVNTEAANFDFEMQNFYENYIKFLENPDGIKKDTFFSFGQKTGKTFFNFLEVMERFQIKWEALKGQVTGPFTLLSAIKDQNERLILYDERMQDIVPKHLAMKALWQAKQLDPFAERVIIFFDEPALAGYGSSTFISISEEFVSKLLKEVCDILKMSGYYTGVHVCANTDWSLLLKSGIDIINFDAYNFGEKFVLYKEDIQKFVEKGGIVAWGIVPTDDPLKIKKESVDNLLELLNNLIEKIIDVETNKKNVLNYSIITPSCGCGTLSEEYAEIVLDLLVKASDALKNRFFT